jgi:hypothetical protein
VQVLGCIISLMSTAGALSSARAPMIRPVVALLCPPFVSETTKRTG